MTFCHLSELVCSFISKNSSTWLLSAFRPTTDTRWWYVRFSPLISIFVVTSILCRRTLLSGSRHYPVKSHGLRTQEDWSVSDLISHFFFQFTRQIIWQKIRDETKWSISTGFRPYRLPVLCRTIHNRRYFFFFQVRSRISRSPYCCNVRNDNNRRFFSDVLQKI